MDKSKSFSIIAAIRHDPEYIEAKKKLRELETQLWEKYKKTFK